MEKVKGNQLLQKLKDGSITSDELALLEDWYLHFAKHAAPFNDPERYKTDIAELKNAFPFQAKPMKVKLWPRIGIAAVVALALFGTLFFTINPTSSTKDRYEIAADVKPGVQGATLTLGNGRQIRISKSTAGELAKEAGISIVKTKDGKLAYQVSGASSASIQTNTLSTSKGEIFEVNLPDGSIVTLNAASSLTFNANMLHDQNRKVKLSGEAFFAVAKDKKHPFIVETGKQQIEVLGTQFNVNSYGDEPATTTTLIEGSVKLQTPQNRSIHLIPGQQAQLKDDDFRITSVDPEEAIAWKNGTFLFSGQDLESVMKQISRWYNVEVVFEDESIKNEVLRGSVSRFEDISQLLEVIEKAGSVKFKVKGRRITATK